MARRVYRVTGRPLRSAPAQVRPYLDTVDGCALLFALGPLEWWGLYRGGVEVGRVSVHA